jgi:tripartite-type tricarboxylate transporter receptor subunit TctC
MSYLGESAAQDARSRMFRSSPGWWWSSLCVVLLLLLCTGVKAQDFPNRPIRLIAPFSPGGGSDAVARILAARMSVLLGKQVIVDNRGGAAGVIGTDAVARAAPDGYTLGFIVSVHAINAATREQLPYHPIKSFAPVALFASAPLVMAVSPSFPAKTVQEFIAAARAKPGKIEYASTGPSSVPHLAAELFKLHAKVDVLHVPYKGVNGVLNDVMAGVVPMTFQGAATIMPIAKNGSLRALAVTSDKRLPAWPDLPTMREAGVPGYEIGVWYGVVAPSGTPADVVAKLNDTIQRVQRDEVALKMVADISASMTNPTTPDQFRDFLVKEGERYKDLVQKMGGIKLN